MSALAHFRAPESIKGWALGALAVFLTVRSFGINAETGMAPVSRADEALQIPQSLDLALSDPDEPERRVLWFWREAETPVHGLRSDNRFSRKPRFPAGLRLLAGQGRKW
nr:hypothetical protein [Zymomonas mobilis]